MDNVIDMKVWQLRRDRPHCFTSEQWDKVIAEASRPADEIAQDVMRRSLFRIEESK